MKILTYNIQYGKGKDDQYDIERIVGEIGDADEDVITLNFGPLVRREVFAVVGTHGRFALVALLGGDGTYFRVRE